ncbi:hypothetical protein [Methanobrevibacter sp. DSM 116169]|uniref:hypothetical protein n=1 Tax=Methanobrevibacter sp. DSM 116169 TaxID=3242727 RepID=UPI0038FCB9C0
MARPIKPTPILTGETAIAFLKEMNEPPTKEELKYMEEVKRIRDKRRVHFKS